ncbi:MAG: sigma-E processing peptidase SpoIIGA [Firmicutes bacterium]|nr:sigma-E processing peptidase SpoIIGA [Bacillota bacterium]
MDVYVDLLFLVNFVLNLWILWATASLSGTPVKRSRLFWSSTCGALYAFGLLTPWGSVFAHPASKLVLALTMIRLAFNPSKRRQVLQLLGLFLLICFATAGAVLGVYVCLVDKSPGGALLAWGDLPLWVLGLSIIMLAVSGRRWLGNLENRFVRVANEAHLSVTIGDLIFELQALVDSGNQLVEPLTGRAVVVVATAAISHLLPKEIVSLTQTNPIWSAQIDKLAASDWVQRIRFVPFQAVANSGGVLLGIRTDYLEIRCQEEVRQVEGVTIALSPAGLGENNQYQALVPPRLLPAARSGKAV